MPRNESTLSGATVSAENAQEPRKNLQDKRAWKAYAAAAGATLAMAANASADIIYSGPVDATASVPVTGGTHKSRVDFPILGLPAGRSASLFVTESDRAGTRYARTADADIGGPFQFAAKGFSSLIDFKPGQPITFVGTAAGQTLLFGANQASVNLKEGRGPFGPGTVSGFIGFEYGNDHGWMRVKVSDRNGDGFPDEAEVIDYAYNNVAGAPIFAGQTVVATPEPGAAALGLFAIGAAGLLAWRRRRAEAASK